MLHSKEIEDEINYAKKLYELRYLLGPIECSCHYTIFNIYYDRQYQVNPKSFTCGNSKCRKKFPITIP